MIKKRLKFARILEFKGYEMTSLTLSANSKVLEQILEFAKNLAKAQNEKIRIEENRFARRYEDDIEAYKRGELEIYDFNEFIEETKSW